MALLRPTAMTHEGPLTGAIRTSRGHHLTTDFDPNPTSAQCAKRTITQFRTIAPFCVISTACTTSSPETILPQSALQPPWYGGF